MRGWKVAMITKSLLANWQHVTHEPDCACDMHSAKRPSDIGRAFPAGWAGESTEEKAAAARAADRRAGFDERAG